jgi:hypothetical protein
MGKHHLRLAEHPSLGNTFEADPEDGLPFIRFALHQGLVRLEASARELPDRQLAVIALTAEGRPQSTIVRLLSVNDSRRPKAAAANEQASRFRRALGAPRGAHLFCLAVARNIMTIETWCPPDSIPPFREDDIPILTHIAEGWSTTSISHELGATLDAIQGRIRTLRGEAGVATRCELVAAAVVANVFDPHDIPSLGQPQDNSEVCVY